MEKIQCRRCGEEAPQLEKPPFKHEIGERVHAEICRGCWAEWLQHQTLLINHYGLDPRAPKSKEFLYGQVEKVLLGDGEAEPLDLSQQGDVSW
ncbi:MAG: oxidative damage protection protein [Gemmatimonadetes bacterium]|nr:oxidative damage protection protein [Gemmatimonadota bacterium]